MNSVLDKYFSRKKSELFDYASKIIQLFSYNLELDIPGKKQIIKKILNIYFNNYYKVENINYDLVSKYYKFDSETDNDFKLSIQSTIEYYETNKLDVLTNNNQVIYLSYIVYFALLIERLRDAIAIIPDKINFIESIANKVNPGFNYIKNDKNKKCINELINNIKINIRDNKKLSDILDRTKNYNSYNEYITFNDEVSFYKIKYNYKLDEVKSYKENDVIKVMNRESVNNSLKLVSYELAQVLLLKCILYDQRLSIVLPVDKDFISKKSTITSFIKLLTSKYTCDYTIVLINSSDYVKCEGIDKIKSRGIKILIETDKMEEVKNIEFDENMILIINNEFLIKYRQDLESRNIKYIKKSTERTYREKDLFFTKVDFMEVR